MSRVNKFWWSTCSINLTELEAACEESMLPSHMPVVVVPLWTLHPSLLTTLENFYESTLANDLEELTLTSEGSPKYDTMVKRIGWTTIQLRAIKAILTTSELFG